MKYSIFNQIIIIMLFLGCFFTTTPIDESACTTVQVVVEDKIHSRGGRINEVCVCSNGVWYVFHEGGLTEEISMTELYEKINVGDTIEITYTERFRILDGWYNLVVDAKDDSNSYVDFDLFNSERQSGQTVTIVLFAVIEVVFLLISGLALLL